MGLKQTIFEGYGRNDKEALDSLASYLQHHYGKYIPEYAKEDMLERSCYIWDGLEYLLRFDRKNGTTKITMVNN